MSILDAMGYGLPVVSTNVGGIPKIVHNGENGFCCEPGNVVAFSDKIISLLSKKQERICASQKSVYIVDKQYSLTNHLNLLEVEYKKITRGLQ